MCVYVSMSFVPLLSPQSHILNPCPSPWPPTLTPPPLPPPSPGCGRSPRQRLVSSVRRARTPFGNFSAAHRIRRQRCREISLARPGKVVLKVKGKCYLMASVY